MARDPADIEMHFEPDLTAADEAEAHRNRGPEQWVYFGANHPIATWFPQRVQRCPAPHPDTLRRAQLKSVIAALASVCARSTTTSETTVNLHYIPPEVIQGRVQIAQQYLPLREYSLELFRATCEEKLAQHVDKLRVEESELAKCDTAAVDPSDASTLIEPTITHFKLMGSGQGSGLLHTYGDFVELIGSHFRREEQRGYTDDSASTRAEFVLDTMEEAAKEVGLVRPRSVKLRVDRLQKMLEKAMWPKELCMEREQVTSFDEEIQCRALLYTNQYKERPGDAMIHLVADRFEHVIKKATAKELNEFIEKHTVGTVNYNQVFAQVRRLMPVATPRVLAAKKPDLNSTEGLELLFKYMKRTRVVWLSNKFKGITDLTSAVTKLLEEAELSEVTMREADKSIVIPTNSIGSSGKSGACSAEYKQLLSEELNSAEFTWIDDRLAAHKDKAPLPDGGCVDVANKDKELREFDRLPWWYHPIRDIVTSSSGAMKRALMGTLKIPARGSAVYLDQLKRHYGDFIHLKLIWDEEEELTDDMLAFKASGGTVAKLLKHTFTNLDVLNDVYEEHRVQVRHAAMKRMRSTQEILTDATAREDYKLIMDRALLCLGYPSVEQQGVSKVSHGAVIDIFEAFLKLGDPLNDDLLSLHREMAVEFVNMATKEAQEVFEEYLRSENPATKHPESYLNKQGVAYLRLARRTINAKELLSKHEYFARMIGGGQAEHRQPTTEIQPVQGKPEETRQKVRLQEKEKIRTPIGSAKLLNSAI